MPTLAGTALTATTTGGGTLTTATFSPASGEVLVCVVVTEDSTLTYNTPTGGGVATWTKQAQVATSNHTWQTLWTGVSAGGTNVTVSSTRVASVSAQDAQMCVTRWSGAQLAATPAIVATSGTGAPNATITTVAANSVVVAGNGDWAAVLGTRTYRSSATEDQYVGISGRYVGEAFHQSAATAGAQSVGMTAPTGETWSIVGVEVQAASGGGSSFPVSGSVAATSAVSAAVHVRRPVSGGVAAVTTSSAAVAARLTVSGVAPAVSATVGAITALRPVSGRVAATSTVAAGAHSIQHAAGVVAGVSTASAAAHVARPVAGAISAVSSISGAVGVIRGAALGVSGTVVASSTVAGAAGLRAAVSGRVGAVSGVAGSAGSRQTVTARVSAVSLVAAVVQALRPVAGTIAAITAARCAVLSTGQPPHDIPDVRTLVGTPVLHTLVGTPLPHTLVGTPIIHTMEGSSP